MNHPAIHSVLIPSQVVSTSQRNQPKGNKNANKKGSHLQQSSLPNNEKTSFDGLIPSQVRVSAKQRQHPAKRKQRQRHNPLTSTHQQAASADSEVQVESDSASTKSGPERKSSSSGSPLANGTEKLPTKRNGRRRGPANAASKGSNKTKNKNSNNKQSEQKFSRFGNLPDIEWGAIPMEHLRLHPFFVPLPLPEDLPKLTNLEDVRNIRQDSWQWDALHDGRCTTSQAVAALGFLEPKAGMLLGIPSSWQRRGIGAYDRLRQPALRTLDQMNALLLAENATTSGVILTESEYEVFEPTSTFYSDNTATTSNNDSNNDTKGSKLSEKLWNLSSSNTSQAFSAKYLAKPTKAEKLNRRERAAFYARYGMAVRMMWGNAQEATSVLTALNYFRQKDTRTIVKEVGMCGAGLDLNRTDGSSPSSLLIGATPDAVIEYADGKIEALEVKNHCPFVLSRTPTKNAKRPMKQFAVREIPFKTPYIFPLYIPQLMLEMLCLGPNCQSAVMIRQTATSGSLILRIHRDENWIDEMLYWLQRFQQDFVEQGVAPPSNFFLDSPEDGVRYRAFLERTKELAGKVDVVAKLPRVRIQRAGDAGDSLFLDSYVHN